MGAIQDVRRDHPEYNDLSDQELAEGLHRRFYSDIPIDDFMARVGVRAMPRQMRSPEARAADADPSVRRQAEQEQAGVSRDEQRPHLTDAARRQDVARSTTTGAQRGASGFAGQFGDAPDLIREGAAAVGEFLGVDPGTVRGAADVIESGVNAVFPATRGATPTTPWPTSAEVSEQIVSAVPERARDWVNHTPQTTAGEYARTAGEFLPMAVGGRGGVIARTARVTAPAAASETAGQLTEGSDLEGPARLVAALLGAGVTESTIQILTRQGMTPDQRAVRLMQRELHDAGYSNDEIVRVANRLTSQAPTEEVMGELMGPSGQRLMRATAAMGRGSGRSIAEETLDARAEGRQAQRRTTTNVAQRGVTSISDRVMGEAARAFAPRATHSPNSYWDMLDTLRASRAAQGADNYRAAYVAPLDQGLVSQHLAPLMRENREAAMSGARQLDSEVQRLTGQRSQLGLNGAPDPQALAAIDADIANAREAAVQLRAIASGEAPNSVNTRAIDYFQRGVSQAEQAAGRGSPEAGALRDFRHGFNGLADQIAPALGDARSQYGRSMAIEDFTELGRRVFQMSDGELERAMRGPGGRRLTTEEFDGFQLGVLDAIENKLGQGDTGFLARLRRNQNWLDNLERATGSVKNARRFMDRLAREAGMQDTRNFVLRGSRTEPLREDIRALTEGEAELGFINDREVRGNILQAGQMALKNPFEAAARLAAWAYDRTRRPGIANPQVQEAMARRLFAQVNREGAKELRDALNAARNDPRLDPKLRTWLESVTALNSATADRGEPAQAP